MKRFQLIVLLALMAFGIACGKKDEGEINVGAILPLTGKAAIYGQAMKNGIQLAYNSLDFDTNIKIIYEDDCGMNSMAVSACTKLINTDHVEVIIGGAMSSTAEAIIPISKRNNVPIVSPGASSPAFDRISKMFFRLWPSDTYDGEVMAKLITRERRLKKIAIFYTQSQYGEGIKSVFVDEVKKHGGTIVFAESFKEGASDFRTQLQKIKSCNPDALFLPGYYAEVVVILKQIKELDIKLKIFGTSSFYDQKMLSELGDAMEGVVFSYPEFDITSKDDLVQKFKDEYVDIYGQAPDVWAALGYDCFKVINSVIRDGAKNSIEIQEGLLRIKNYPGVAGYFSFDEFGNVIKNFSIYTIRDHDFKKVNMEDGE